MVLERDSASSISKRVPGLCGPTVKRTLTMMVRVENKLMEFIHLLSYKPMTLKNSWEFSLETPMLNHQFLYLTRMEVALSAILLLEEA
jgi:hypothetical protein